MYTASGRVRGVGEGGEGGGGMEGGCVENDKLGVRPEEENNGERP